MNSPNNERLRRVLSPLQGRKLVVISGNAVRDLFFLGNKYQPRPLVDALHRIGGAESFEITLAFDSQGEVQFGSEAMKTRFEECSSKITQAQAGEEHLQAYSPASEGARPAVRGRPVAMATAANTTNSSPAGDGAAANEAESRASSKIRNFLGRLDRVWQTDTRVLAMFCEPEELWLGPLTAESYDVLRQAATLGYRTGGNPLSRLVFIVKPGRRSDFVIALEMAEATESIREDIDLGAPTQDELRAFLGARMRSKSLIGDSESVVAEWHQRGLLLHSLNESLRQVSDTDRRVEAVLDRGLPNTTPEQVLEELNGLVGLDSVKSQVERLLKLSEQQSRDRRAGRAVTPVSTHMLFLGGPGTGKTEVARIVARFLRAVGLRSSGEFVEISRTELASEYNSGECIQRMREAVERATGGVLFIDEAYQLASGPWMEGALETLMKLMEDRRATLTVIMAGYEQQMEQLWTVNPGFRSRIPESNWLRFPDYAPSDLEMIFRRMCEQEQLEISDQVAERARQFIDFELRRGRFGNARGVRNLVDRVIQNRATRGGGTATPDMVPEPARFDQKRVGDLLTKLEDKLVGLPQLRTEYLEIISARAQNAERDREPLPGPLHCRFVGPPGTGKTTAGRLVGEIFQAMGVVSRGHLVELNPMSDLTSPYAGGFSQRVAARFREARGGLLLIDEAYQLADDPQGRQIIDQIVNHLTSREFADTVVILSGYRDSMNLLFEQNKGLKQRIPFEVVFEQLPLDKLAKLFHDRLEAEGYVVGGDEQVYGERPDYDRVLQDFDRVLCLRLKELSFDPHFANARSVENFLRTVLDRQSKRVIKTDDARHRRVLILDLGEEPGEPDRVEALMEELENRFVGILEVKETIRELARDFWVESLIGGAPPKTPRLLFRGNPGTGKTTVGRHLGKILRALGCVANGSFVETRGVELKAPYLGQTEERVLNAFNNARGGVLFIDEVYALMPEGAFQDSYSAAAVNTMVGQLELPANSQTVVILAGYADRITEFLTANPGLASRFPDTVDFPDYSDEECVHILHRWFAAVEPERSLPLKDPMVHKILTLAFSRARVPGFGNARDVETLGQRIRRARNNRVYVPRVKANEIAPLMDPTPEDISQAVNQWLKAKGLDHVQG